jgi:hypothetical protein
MKLLPRPDQRFAKNKKATSVFPLWRKQPSWLQSELLVPINQADNWAWHQVQPLYIITRGFLPRIVVYLTNANYLCQAIMAASGSNQIDGCESGFGPIESLA